MDLGGDDQVRALDAEIVNRLAEHLLGLAEGVDVGGVDEVDAGGDRARDDAVDGGLVEAVDVAPEAGLLLAEGHRAEADFGNEQAGIAELVVAH